MLMCFDPVFQKCAIWNDADDTLSIYRLADGRRLQNSTPGGRTKSLHLVLTVAFFSSGIAVPLESGMPAPGLSRSALIRAKAAVAFPPAVLVPMDASSAERSPMADLSSTTSQYLRMPKCGQCVNGQHRAISVSAPLPGPLMGAKWR
jgi:hypothetical protein